MLLGHPRDNLPVPGVAVPALGEDGGVAFEADGRRGHLRTSYIGVDDELLDAFAHDTIRYIVQGLVESL